MTLQGALPTGSEERGAPDRSADDAGRDPGHRARTRRAVAFWAGAVVVVVLVVAWQVAGRNPALPAAGITYTDLAFVQDVGSDLDEDATWVVWDEPAGAQVATVLRNDRPWPVTVTAVDPTSVTSTRFAPFSAEEGSSGQLVDDAFTEQLTVPARGQVLLAVRISAGCVGMSAGSSTGVSEVTVATTALGVGATAQIPLGALYLAGFTTDHEPGPECEG